MDGLATDWRMRGVSVAVKKIEAKSALYKLNRRGLPYQWDLNIYRGCSVGCKYCYARKSHQYLGSDHFDTEIFAKVNVAEILDLELEKGLNKGQIINLGGVCDSYQGCERHLELMRDVLKVMIKHRNPIIISTKSDLILRDLDLIEELASLTYVNIASSITVVRPEDSVKIEPGASLPLDRVRLLSECGRTNAHTGFHFMPILPFISDDEASLEQMVRWAREAEVSYMLSGFLYLTGGIRKRYLDFIGEVYPELLEKYEALYVRGGADKAHKARVHSLLKKYRDLYHVNNSYAKFLPK